MATEIGQSKNTESFNVCIVLETERVAARWKGHMKNRTTYHTYSVVNGHIDRSEREYRIIQCLYSARN